MVFILLTGIQLYYFLAGNVAEIYDTISQPQVKTTERNVCSLVIRITSRDLSMGQFPIITVAHNSQLCVAYEHNFSNTTQVI